MVHDQNNNSVPFLFRWEKTKAATPRSVTAEAVLERPSPTMTSGTGSKPRERGLPLVTLQPHVSPEVLESLEAHEIRDIPTEQIATRPSSQESGSQKASPGTSPGQVTLTCQQVPRPQHQHQLQQQRPRPLLSLDAFRKLTRVTNGLATNHERNPIPNDLVRNPKSGRNCDSRPSSVEHIC